ncbi:lipopolysaccharide kinase InaA family protein [Methylophilus sp. Leaf416]|uniref:lipopolysaccharide kinase InaA family protein n=1 Tax=unclassified Methylophilus TaxID=2630143 RepID=UPI002E15BED2
MKRSPLPSMLTSQVLLDGLSYIFKGGLWLKNSHLPQKNHAVPAHFVGICVATNTQPETDDYVLAQLAALGLGRVRLDIGDDDMYVHQIRLLQRLLDASLIVDVHLVQPFAIAKHMLDGQVQARWQQFVEQFLQQYASQIASLEIGNTINRKRWSGYHWPGFMHAWQIAHRLARQYGVKVVGPNIQDFEPLYNISAFKKLQAEHLLPDIHSNNLFVERVIEPEQPDHRIFQFRWTRYFKFNLIKKARLLQKIGADYGVETLISPVAFWAIYRIQRHLPDGGQKQADYVTRYFTLLAASGALQQANWGAMICHREGVINDGLDDARYPALERVAYYQSADGNLHEYQRNPSFSALRTVARWLNGAEYVGPLATGNGLEIHQLRKHQKQFHIAWTVNGHCAVLNQVYAESSLRQVECINRNGQAIAQPALITEMPVYLMWDAAETVELHTTHPKLSQTIIHAHIQGMQYFPVQEGDWRGMILAESKEQAAQLWYAWHPGTLKAPAKEQALRHARNAIWPIADPRLSHKELTSQRSGKVAERKVTVKQPIRMHWHKTLLDRLKPSKAKRSWNGAMELLRRGVGTAMPLAYFERADDTSLKQNFFICEFVTHDFTIAQAFIAFSQGAEQFNEVPALSLYQSFARFCLHMHASGIYFRDFSGGNILVSKQDDGLTFSLIDTARLHAHPTATTYSERIADLTRAVQKLHWDGRKQFLALYLGMSGHSLNIGTLLPFYLYDFKVHLKRTIGRKGMRKLLSKLKNLRAGKRA